MVLFDQTVSMPSCMMQNGWVSSNVLRRMWKELTVS
jgi:hypothetical protein